MSNLPTPTDHHIRRKGKMGRLGVFLTGLSLGVLGVGAYYVFGKKKSTLSAQQLLEIAKEKVRQEEATKRNVLLAKVVGGTLVTLYVLSYVRGFFVGRHHHHHRHHHNDH
jgi:hypothetical protein